MEFLISLCIDDNLTQSGPFHGVEAFKNVPSNVFTFATGASTPKLINIYQAVTVARKHSGTKSE